MLARSPGGTADARHASHPSAKPVLVIRVDGLHARGRANAAAQHPPSPLVALRQHDTPSSNDLLMREPHASGAISRNSNVPFLKALAPSATLATNDFAVGHLSLTTSVETPDGVTGAQRALPSIHFSLRKTLEAGFGLLGLNHAGDRTVKGMSDLLRTDGHHA